jgi:hypothetical protein
MKTLKVICTALVLACVLSVPAQAGDISTPGMKAEQPVPTTTATNSGDLGSVDVSSTTSSQLDAADLIEFLITLVF